MQKADLCSAHSESKDPKASQNSNSNEEEEEREEEGGFRVRALVRQAHSLAWLCRRSRVPSLHRRDHSPHVPSRARGRQTHLKEVKVSRFYPLIMLTHGFVLFRKLEQVDITDNVSSLF